MTGRTPSDILRTAAGRLRDRTKRPAAAEPIARWLEDEAWHAESARTAADTTPAFRNGPLHFALVVLARRP